MFSLRNDSRKNFTKFVYLIIEDIVHSYDPRFKKVPKGPTVATSCHQFLFHEGIQIGMYNSTSPLGFIQCPLL